MCGINIFIPLHSVSTFSHTDIDNNNSIRIQNTTKPSIPQLFLTVPSEPSPNDPPDLTQIQYFIIPGLQVYPPGTHTMASQDYNPYKDPLTPCDCTRERMSYECTEKGCTKNNWKDRGEKETINPECTHPVFHNPKWEDTVVKDKCKDHGGKLPEVPEGHVRPQATAGSSSGAGPSVQLDPFDRPLDPPPDASLYKLQPSPPSRGSSVEDKEYSGSGGSVSSGGSRDSAGWKGSIPGPPTRDSPASGDGN